MPLSREEVVIPFFNREVLFKNWRRATCGSLV